MEVLPELEPPFKTITGFTRSTIAGRCKEALHRSGRTELALNKSHIELPPGFRRRGPIGGSERGWVSVVWTRGDCCPADGREDRVVTQAGPGAGGR